MATGAPTAQRQAVPIRHRPNIEEMTGPQVEELRAAFTEVQKILDGDERSYAHHAGHHGLPLPPECKVAHGQPAFLPWHRAYLYRFELALRDTGRDVMLPWWDWTRTPDIPAAYKDKETSGGNENPLFSVAIATEALEQGKRALGDEEEDTRRLAGIPNTMREPGLPNTRLPTAPQISAALTEEKDYEEFRRMIERYHGNVHMWVGGHMSNLPFAAFDPIFWAHHCMIDRLWRMWQLEHPQASFPASLRPQPMEPFNLTAEAVLDPTALGYDYAISIAQVRPS
jgi:tyrosinase